MSQARFVTPDEADTMDVPSHDGSPQTWPTDYYFGAQGRSNLEPQAFRVAREPHYESRAHFHHVDQFQVFFGASDTVFQRHNTGPLLVHYSDADTLYGPFSAGEAPFTFMTLRAHGSDFKGHMPEHKAEMSHAGTKRHYHNDLAAWLGEPFPSAEEGAVEAFLDVQADNLAAYRVSIAPGAKITAPSPAGSGGQYLVVVDGELVEDGRVLPAHTVGWAAPDDDAPVLTAGDHGARVVVLQFGERNAAA